MKLIYKIAIAGIVLAYGEKTAAQQSPLTDISDRLSSYHATHLQEKLFVHTDKSVYLAGEICWFKAYVVEAGSNQPLDLSKVAYLEWLDKNNKPVLQAKIGLEEGHGNGSVYLPVALPTGNYKLRAYTNWMKNDGPETFFEQSIAVVNARLSADTATADSLPVYHAGIFPEGGVLVENQMSRVAFRLTDQSGQSATCSGVLVADDRDTLARLETRIFGMGSFSFTPKPASRYKAVFRLSNGAIVTEKLPVAEKQGAVMQVSSPDAAHWRIDVGATGVGSSVYLIAQTRKVIRVAQRAALQDGSASFLIDRNILGEGVSQLTIFDEDRRPLCERLVFKNPGHRLHLAASSDAAVYSTRQKINIRVDAKNSADLATDADCSLSVFRIDSLSQLPSGHIESWLWLGSELTGRIEAPDYYLDHPEDETAADLLMQTQGWRKFHWENIFKPSAFEYAPEYHGALFSGKMIDTHTGAPAKAGIHAYLSVPGTRTQFTIGTTDAAGRVNFELKDFYGGKEIVVQTNHDADSVYRVDIANPFYEGYKDFPISKLTVPASLEDLLQEKNTAVQVLNRYTGERLKRFQTTALVDSGLFYGYAENSYPLDDYTRFTTMEEVLREYVHFILVKKRDGHYHIPVLDLNNNQMFEKDPLILLDGVPISDIDQLMTLDPLKIRKLDMINHRYFFGGMTNEGIMNWTSYKGDLAGFVLNPHAVALDYEGLQLQREFYSPSYASPEQQASHLPDFRNVLYWTPSLSVNKGEKPATFYSSDIPGKYLVIVEGLAADGAAGTGVAHFEVKTAGN